MDGCVVINVRFNRDKGDDPTILKVPYDIYWQDFELLLKLNFDCTDITVKYLDEDSDYILVSTDQDLQEALMHARRSEDVLELMVIESPLTPRKASSKGVTSFDQQIAMATDLDPAEAVAMIDQVVEDHSPQTSVPHNSALAVTVQTNDQTDEPQVECAQMNNTEDDKIDVQADQASNEANLQRLSLDDAQETGERVFSRSTNKEKRAMEVKRRGARSKARRGESCYTRCAQDMGEYRRCHSQPEEGKRHLRHLPRDQESGEARSPDAPVSYNMLMEFLNKLKEDLRTEIVRDVTRKTVKQVLKGLDGAVIQSVQGSKRPASESVVDGNPDTPASEHPSYIHDGIICDNCNQKIVGVRYKCGNCEDFDLCEACESRDGMHTPDHVFVKLRRPWAGVGKVSDVPVPLLRCLVYEPATEICPTDGEGMEDVQTHPRWERFKEKVARMQEKLKRKEEKRLEKFKRKEEKLKRRLEHERSLPVKRERLDIPQLRRRGKFDADFIEDVTIPDGTRVQPGTKMLKTWILKNTGNTVWSETTMLRMVWGSMTATYTEVSVPHLGPLEQGPVTVELIAPSSTGRYQSHWKMHDSGVNFGHRVWCAVIVEPKEILEPTYDETIKVTQSEPVAEEQDVIDGTGDLLEDGPVDMTIGRREKEVEVSVPMIPLQPALSVQVPDVVSMATPEEPKTEKSGSDQVEENLTTAAAVVAQLQRGQERSQPQATKGDNSPNDLLSFELVDVEKREMPGLSHTATPNNTPSVLTPPKSPVAGGPMDRVLSNSSSVEMVAEVGLDEDETTSTEMLDYVQERMASLGLRPDHDFELESLSSSTDDEDSTSSDGDFFIVPLPDCFCPDKPLTFSQLAEHNMACDENFNVAESRDLNPDLSLDDILTVSSRVETPTLSPVSSPVTSVTPGNQTPTGSVDKSVMTSTETGEVIAAAEQQVEEMAKLSHQSSQTEAAATTTTTVDIGVSADSQATSLESGETCTDGGATSTEAEATQDELSSNSAENGAAATPEAEIKGQQQQQQQQQAKAGEFANQLMSTAVTAATRAATHAYSTAKEVFLTWQAKHAEGQAVYVPPKSNWKPPADNYVPPQSQWTPPEDSFTPPQSNWTPPESTWAPPAQTEQPRSEIVPMEQLMSMGFCNRAVNAQLLETYENDVEKVVQELLSGTENDWATRRH